VDVIHCEDAYALILQHKSWGKLVYSGDTRPSKKLIEAGKDAKIVIHEATFEDDLQNEAIMKNHSTTKEAISAAELMMAQFLIMFHFSQRYPKIPVFDESQSQKTTIAFDFMTISANDFQVMPKLLPALRAVFKEEDVMEIDATTTCKREPNEKQKAKTVGKKIKVTHPKTEEQ